MEEASSSSGGVDKESQEKAVHAMATVSGKLKVVRVKRKREQAPIENLCKLDSDLYP